MTLTHSRPDTEVRPAPQASMTAGTGSQERWIEIDLTDADMPTEITTLDDRAAAASQIYERFVPYADEGWEWVIHPASRRFDGWMRGNGSNEGKIVGARMLCRRVGLDDSSADRPSHGVSGHRTRQLTRRAWTSEPASKVWKPMT